MGIQMRKEFNSLIYGLLGICGLEPRCIARLHPITILVRYNSAPVKLLQRCVMNHDNEKNGLFARLVRFSFWYLIGRYLI